MKRALLFTIIIAMLAMGCTQAEPLNQAEDCTEVNFDILSLDDGVIEDFDKLTMAEHELLASADDYNCRQGFKEDENVNNVYCDLEREEVTFGHISADEDGLVEEFSGVIVKQLVFSEGEVSGVECFETLF